MSYDFDLLSERAAVHEAPSKAGSLRWATSVEHAAGPTTPVSLRPLISWY